MIIAPFIKLYRRAWRSAARAEHTISPFRFKTSPQPTVIKIQQESVAFVLRRRIWGVVVEYVSNSCFIGSPTKMSSTSVRYRHHVIKRRYHKRHLACLPRFTIRRTCFDCASRLDIKNNPTAKEQTSHSDKMNTVAGHQPDLPAMPHNTRLTQSRDI